MEVKFKINEFEGPLDLLLHLIKENKMDIIIELQKKLLEAMTTSNSLMK